MTSYDIYVHPSFPDQPGFPGTIEMKNKYFNSLSRRIGGSNGEKIIVTSPFDSSQELVLSSKSQVRKIPGEWFLKVDKQDNKIGRSCSGYLRCEYLDIIRELAYGEKITLNGSLFGQCPEMLMAQVKYYQTFQEYFPKRLENIVNGESYYEFCFSEIEDEFTRRLWKSSAPDNWKYGISSTPYLNNAVRPIDKRRFTFSMLNQDSKIYVLCQPDNKQILLYKLRSLFDKNIKRKLTPSLITN